MKSIRSIVPVLAVLIFALHASTAAAWTTHITCEGGTVGTKVQQNGPNEFTSTFLHTLYANAVVGSGNESCQMGIDAGSDGWGSWGAIYNFPTHLGVGSQLWIRLSMYVPQSFNLTATPWLKFFRVHTSAGYMDLLINPPNQYSSPFTYYYSPKPKVDAVGVRPQDNVVKGKWQTYEIYLKFGTVSKDNGGTGEVRVWENNKLLADLTDQVTLVYPTTYADSFYLFTYWNHLAPATQHLYIDDVTITNDTPSHRDAEGNPCICSPVMGVQPTPPNVTVH